LQKGHPPRACHLPAVTILCQDRLLHLRPGQIVIKNIIHDHRNRFVDVPAVDPFVIKGRRGCDREIISLVAVPFRIYTVQRKRHNCQHICRNSRLRPCSIDLAGCYIFNIIPVWNIIIFRCRIAWHTIMNHNSLRNYHTRKNDLSALSHRFDLTLRDLWRKCSIKCVVRDHNIFLPLTARICQRYHPHTLDRRCICKNFRTGYHNRLKTRRCDPHRIFGIWTNVIRRSKTQLHRRRIQCHIFRLTRTIRKNLFQNLVRLFCSRYGNFCICNRKIVRIRYNIHL